MTNGHLKRQLKELFLCRRLKILTARFVSARCLSQTCKNFLFIVQSSAEMRLEMEKVGRAIVKIRIPILIASILLLIPAAFGYIKTRVNYDILYYLPKEIDTMQGAGYSS